MNKSAILAVAGAACTANAQLINEFQPNPTGGDPAQVNFELFGTAGATFNGVIYALDTDFGGGVDNPIDRLSAVSGTFDANGILNVMIDDLENPSFSVVLASGGAGGLGDTYDGTNGAALFGTVFDAINIADNDTDGANSIIPTLGVGTDFAFTGDEPRLVFRDSVSFAWYAVNDPDNGEVYDVFGNVVDPSLFSSDPLVETFGAVNPFLVPTPGVVALAGAAGLLTAGRRRR